MLFRRIVLSSLLVGALAGLVLSAVQLWQVIPIIQGAERYEAAPAPAEHEHAAGSAHSHSHAPGEHDHSAADWKPAEGAERFGYTVLSNVLTAIGFALVVLAAMAVLLKRNPAARIDWRRGLLWGIAGYATFFVAPGLGLPPEIPGAEAAPLQARQAWWVLAVACTGAGLAVAALGKSPWRWAALLLLAVPYLVGAPQLAIGPFEGQPPEAAAALSELAHRFVWATALANAAFWLVLGATSGWAVRRFLRGAVELSHAS
jgi:cobalt transporter subunit CbtA